MQRAKASACGENVTKSAHTGKATSTKTQRRARCGVHDDKNDNGEAPQAHHEDAREEDEEEVVRRRYNGRSQDLPRHAAQTAPNVARADSRAPRARSSSSTELERSIFHICASAQSNRAIAGPVALATTLLA
eukprot:7386904-Prymnesium_polylepis.2